jgi:hypothetical protein
LTDEHLFDTLGVGFGVEPNDLLPVRDQTGREEVARVSLVERLRGVRADLAGFDPAVWSAEDCTVLVGELAAVENAAAAAKTRAAARAAACGTPRAHGYADAADWLARESGTTARVAKAALDTTAGLDRCPDTRARVADGTLSLGQAEEIVRTEAVAPGSESDLLALAGRTGFRGLRDQARRRRQEAMGAEALHRRQRAARHFRHWSTELGMIAVAGELAPEVGVPFVNRLDAETDRIRRHARRHAAATGGELEPREAHAADAFARLVAGQGRGHATRSDLVIVCDLAAYRRGHAHPGEPVHIVGGSPLPVAVVRDLADDAFLKAVLHDGRRIETVVHDGRHIPAELRTALELGAPPDFPGTVCCEPGCDRRHGLEWDHDDPLANRGPTSLANLTPRCWPHHRAKTERDRAAGLLRPRPRGNDEPP